MRSHAAQLAASRVRESRAASIGNGFSRSISFVMLVILSPLMVVIAVLIVSTSPGPVLIKRPVSACGGQVTYVTEFRTRPWFDPVAYDLDPCAAKSHTRLGRLLHITSLSRLPRFLDIYTASREA